MKYSNYILLILITVILSACSEVIDFDLNDQENSRLVVEGNITDQTKEHTVKLTRTSSYYENEPAPKETGANVTISDGVSLHTLTETSPGIYQTASNYKGEIGKTYTLDITTTNNDFYTASSTLTSVSHIDTILVDLQEGMKGGGGDEDEDSEFVLALKHYGPEPATTGNNYMWLVTLNDINKTETVTDITFVTDEFVNGNYIADFNIHEIDVEEVPLVDTLRLNVELHSISREYHDFLLAIFLETEYNGTLFSGPPANIPSNISNGALGFFRASAVYSKYIEIENPL
jgi:hypothetical protein